MTYQTYYQSIDLSVPSKLCIAEIIISACNSFSAFIYGSTYSEICNFHETTKVVSHHEMNQLESIIDDFIHRTVQICHHKDPNHPNRYQFYIYCSSSSSADAIHRIHPPSKTKTKLHSHQLKSWAHHSPPLWLAER